MEIQMSEAQGRIEKLKTTEGWNLLTPLQQKIIRTSLLITPRAYRGNDPARFLDKDMVKPAYQTSGEHVAAEYCHTAIMALETGKLVTSVGVAEDLRIDPDFYNARSYKLQEGSDKLGQLGRLIKDFGVPCVVQPGVNPAHMQPPTAHSFLALGKGNDGDFWCWEKRGLGLPYRARTLKEEYNDYDQFAFWAIRKLRNLIPQKK